MDRSQASFCCRQASQRSLQTVWQMSSYSALVSQSRHEEERSAVETELPAIAAVTEDNLIEVHDLPAGAHFGNLVHDLLEKVPFADLARGVDFTESSCTIARTLRT